MAEVVWSDEATEALKQAARYGKRKFGTTVARNFYQQIKANDLRLEHSPELGKIEPQLTGCFREYRSLVVHEHYKLIYYIEADIVRVSALWDVRSNPDKLIDSIH